MRTFALIALAAALPAAGMAAARAMPLPVPAGTGGIVEVSGGCGPGGHRDFYGRCVPNFRPLYRPFYRPVYRVCPPGFHLGPYRGRCFPNY